MKHLLSSITLLLLSTLAYGQVPNTFSSGETISSSKINANFAYVSSAIKNDNITAMMVCEHSGFSNGKYYYAGCYSTNDETFENSIQISTRFISNSSSQGMTLTFNNAISLKNLFDNKWILYDSKYHGATVSQAESSSGYPITNYIFQKHTFYKVSSD